jgi:hypothetical protein
MEAKILAWYLCRSFTFSCWFCCLGTQSKDGSHVLPQYHVVFDDLFTTAPFMEKSEVPPNWADLAERSQEHVIDEHYELAKTWLFPIHEPGDISMLDPTNNDPTCNIFQEKSLNLNSLY